MNDALTPRRSYRMVKRAVGAQRTVDAVIDAVMSFVPERSWEDVTVEEIAAAAGVSVRTVMRRFGSKDGLAEAAAEQARADVSAQRTGDAAGDLKACVAELVEHYEQWGATALWLLEHRRRVPVLGAAAEQGSQLHEEWVRKVFAPQLDALGVRGAERRRVTAALSAATDVTTWDVMRHRSGLSRPATQKAIAQLCAGVLRAEEA